MIHRSRYREQREQPINVLSRYPSLQEEWFIVIDVVRKPTHADRYLDFNSQHEKKHKISTASTVLNRACNLPNTFEGKLSEVNHVTNALLAKGYPAAVMSNVLKKKKRSPELIPSPEELVGLFFNLIENKSTAMACLPVCGVTEPLSSKEWN